MPGAKIQDDTERLPQLVKRADYYPLLFHVGTNAVVKNKLGKIKQDLKALRAQVKGTGAQVIFSILRVRDRNTGRS